MYKNVSHLKLTNEIKSYVDRCVNENTYLMIKVPEICTFSKKLTSLIDNTVDENGQNRIRILRQKI